MKNKKKLINVRETEEKLFREISLLIDASKQSGAVYARSVLTVLFWDIGKIINEVVLQSKRAEYGKQIVSTLSAQLQGKYGRSFEFRNLRRMLQFAEQFSNKQIIIAASKKLSWSHFVEILPLKTIEAKMFYIKEIINHGLGIRELRRQISLKVFEKSSMVNLQVPVKTFKNPYVFGFSGLQTDYLENDFEAAILKEFETFILGVGEGFAFVNGVNK